jgi:hypothetical protein
MHPLQQLEVAEVFSRIGGMDCIKLRREHGYLHLHGNHNMSGLNSMSNMIKELIKTHLNVSVGLPNTTKLIKFWEHCIRRGCWA